MRVILPAVAALLIVGADPRPVRAADDVQLTLKQHRFSPAEVTVPMGVRFRIEIVNEDDTPGEFESSDLRIEKIVVAGGRISVLAGPLKPGSYKFFDDYHPDTATGTLVAAEKKD